MGRKERQSKPVEAPSGIQRREVRIRRSVFRKPRRHSGEGIEEADHRADKWRPFDPGGLHDEEQRGRGSNTDHIRPKGDGGGKEAL